MMSAAVLEKDSGFRIQGRFAGFARDVGLASQVEGFCAAISLCFGSEAAGPWIPFRVHLRGKDPRLFA
jgi:hypothetical protein